jgi:MoaA/NifB/PqqE/SkfB family radical SAM enzyme
MAAVVARGLPARAAMVVMADNAGDAAATRDFVRGLGVGSFSARPASAVGRGDRYRGEVDACDAEVERADAPPRARPQGKLCVMYDGRVTPCIFNRDDVVGRVPERRLRDIARAPDPAAPRGSVVERLAELGDRLACRSCRLTACAIRASIG